MDLKTSLVFAAFVTIFCATNGVTIKQDEDHPIWAHALKQFQHHYGRPSDGYVYVPRFTNQRQKTLRKTNHDDVTAALPEESIEFQQELYDLARLNEKIKNNGKKLKQATVSTWNSSAPKKVNEDYSVSGLRYASRNTHDYVSNEDLLERYNNLVGAKRKEFDPIKIGFNEPKQPVVSSGIDLESIPSIQELVKVTLNQEHAVKDTPNVNRLHPSAGEHIYARFNQNFQPDLLFSNGNAWVNRPHAPEYAVNENKANSQIENGNYNDSDCACRKSVFGRSAARNNRQRSHSSRIRTSGRP